MLQIYCGNGKGKTTASVGAAVRVCGAGLSVLFVQFLKDGSSSELNVLRDLNGITVLIPDEFYGFTSQLNEEQRESLKACYGDTLVRVKEWIKTHSSEGELKGMIVMDELLHVINAGLVDEADITALLDEYCTDYEFVITGYYPTAALVQKADYISNITAEKHPYSNGITSRKGIEF